MTKLFPDTPDHARVWVFALANELSQAQHGVVTARLDEFLSAWKSHGTPVRGAYRILEHLYTRPAVSYLMSIRRVEEA